MDELKKQIIKLKEENLHLQNILYGNNNILGDIRKIEDDMKNININKTTKIYFIDKLLLFYDEVVEYVNLANEETNIEDIDYFLYKITDSYKENRDFLLESISKKKIDEMDKSIEFVEVCDLRNRDKIDFLYDSFYNILFIEFLGDYTYSVSV